MVTVAVASALAVTLVILAVAGTIRKIDALVHRRQDAHVPIVVRPGRYDALVDTLEETLAQTHTELEAARLIVQEMGTGAESPGSPLALIYQIARPHTAGEPWDQSRASAARDEMTRTSMGMR